MKTIYITNQKGGAGKTTTVNELAVLLGKEGKKVLVIDADAQCHLTTNLDAQEARKAIVHVLTGMCPVQEAIVKVRENVDLIAGSRKMLPQLFTRSDDLYLLKEMLEIVNEDYDYDYVLIDSGPGAGSIMEMCMLASDYIIAVTTSDPFSRDGVVQLMNDYQTMKKRYNDFKARLLGTIIADYTQTLVSENGKNELTEIGLKFGCMPFKTIIRHSCVVDECKDVRSSINEWKYNSKPAFDYRHLLYDIKERIKDFEEEEE